MKKLLSIGLTIATLLLAVMVVHQHIQHSSWHEDREVINYCVCHGDTLYGIGYAHKPTWMDVREYCHEVLALNGMDNCDLYVGQTIKIYTIIGE